MLCHVSYEAVLRARTQGVRIGAIAQNRAIRGILCCKLLYLPCSARAVVNEQVPIFRPRLHGVLTCLKWQKNAGLPLKQSIRQRGRCYFFDNGACAPPHSLRDMAACEDQALGDMRIFCANPCSPMACSASAAESRSSCSLFWLSLNLASSPVISISMPTIAASIC